METKIEIEFFVAFIVRMASLEKTFSTKKIPYSFCGDIGNVLPEINCEYEEHSTEAKLVILEKRSEHPKITVWVEPKDTKVIDFGIGYSLRIHNTDDDNGSIVVKVKTTMEYDIKKKRNYFECQIKEYKGGIKEYELQIMLADKKYKDCSIKHYGCGIKILKYSINVSKCYINILNYLEKDEWSNIHKQQDLCVLFLQKIDDYLNDVVEVLQMPEVVYKDTVDDLMKHQKFMVDFIKEYECQRDDGESDSSDSDDDDYYPTKKKK